MTRGEQLELLIRTLAPGQAVPADDDEKWALFRALVNTRPPEPVGEGFLRIQDSLLRGEIAAKGITRPADWDPAAGPFYLWRGDITTLAADAIVNAANSGMLGCFLPGHWCIDNAIHTYAGVQLRLECAAVMDSQGYPEPPGRAKITRAYNLPAKYVLHTVGPVVDGPLTGEHRRLLADCYRSCLRLADRRGLKSVAFCCISTGEFRFPQDQAAAIAVDTVKETLRQCRHVDKIIFNVFTQEDEQIYRRLLAPSGYDGPAPAPCR